MVVLLFEVYQSLPIELEKVSVLPGSCNPMQIFLQDRGALTKPSLATVGIFSFLWNYNDLFSQTFFLRSKRPVGDHTTAHGDFLQGRYELRPDGSSGDTDYHATSGCVCLQKYIIKV